MLAQLWILGVLCAFMRRIFHIVVAINSLIASFIVKTPYRQLIIDEAMQASRMADYLCTFFFTLALPFVVFSIFSPATLSFGLILILLCTLLSLIFEFAQVFNDMAFDWADVYSIIAGGTAAAGLFWMSRKMDFS